MILTALSAVSRDEIMEFEGLSARKRLNMLKISSDCYCCGYECSACYSDDSLATLSPSSQFPSECKVSTTAPASLLLSKLLTWFYFAEADRVGILLELGAWVDSLV